MTQKEWEILNNLFQDIIQGLDADLESGVHWMNNEAWDNFNKKHKRFNEALDKLSQWITQQELQND